MLLRENNNPINSAAAKWPRIISALEIKHRDGDPFAFQDSATEALIRFEKALKGNKIEHPEKPLKWLISTAEHLYQHERRKHSKIIPIDQLATEPISYDESIEDFENNDFLKNILSEMPNDDYRNVYLLLKEGYSVQEVAERMGRSVKAIYHLKERSIKKAKEIAYKLDPDICKQASKQASKQAKTMPNEIKIILKNNRIWWGIWGVKRDYTKGCEANEKVKCPNWLALIT